MGMFPLMINLNGKPVTVIGGGKTAYRKVSELTKAGAIVTVIADTFDLSFDNAGIKMVTESVIDEKMVKQYISGAFFVVIAVSEEKTGDMIERICTDDSILYNRVDSVESPTYFTSWTDIYGVTISVSTSGLSPALSKFLMRKIQGTISPYCKALPVIKRIRDSLAGQSIKEKSEYFSRIFQDINFWKQIEDDDFDNAFKYAMIIKG